MLQFIKNPILTIYLFIYFQFEEGVKDFRPNATMNVSISKNVIIIYIVYLLNAKLYYTAL